VNQLIETVVGRPLAQIKHVSPLRPSDARVSAIYSQIERDFGVLAPQLALHSPVPDILAASWLMLRETLIARGKADRTTKEAVATIVALGNSCQYCVDMHTATMDALNEAHETDPGYDLDVRRVADWARAARLRHAAHHDAPFPGEQTPELIGVMVAAQYLTRMTNVFLPDSPLPTAGRSRASALLGRFLLTAANRRATPGASLLLLPAADLPEDLDWARGNPNIANAFARACAVIDDAAPISDEARALVLGELSNWDGVPPGADPNWVIDAVASLPFVERPAARLALLVAVASKQVDQEAVDDVRRAGAGDQALISITAWASLAAARLVGGWAAASSSSSERRPTLTVV
jgi:AhpD family alkylhydroperoxidase